MSEPESTAARRQAAYPIPTAEEARARRAALVRMLDEWAADESGCEAQNADAIDRARRGYPLSLREHPVK